MKKERLLNAIGQIDEKMIADALDEKALASARKEIRIKRKKVTQWVSALAACLVLALFVGLITPFAVGNAKAGKVTMEINPGVEYVITKNGDVKTVRFLNEDAKKLLEEVEMKGQNIKTAVALTIAAYKNSGYMERNDTVLISFDKKLSENEKLKESVSEFVREALEESKSVHTVVYVTATDDAKTTEIAEKHGISQGKAKLVADAAANNDISEEELVKLPLDELVGLQREINSTVVDTKYIGILKAKEIALKDAGCTTRVEFTEAVLVDNGVKYPYYRLVFKNKYTQWTYLVNAVNGEIIEKNELALFISLDEAKTIALKHSGISDKPEIKVVFTKEELSRNQGRPCWILEFYTAEFQYFYKIDAKTGEVFFFEYHIDIRKAKEIALTDAGVIAEIGKITFTVEEYVGGGIKTPYFYFVFNNDATQWTYRIDATNGTVIEKNKTTLFISLQQAREIALKDSGIARESKIVITKEELINLEAEMPYFFFVFNDGQARWTYRIDAASGKILDSKKEPLKAIHKESDV